MLRGADGVVFVADSQAELLAENLESMQNLKENLRSHGADPEEVPLVIQYNKRDLPGVLPVTNLDRALNDVGAPIFEAAAVAGTGVFETLRSVSELVLRSISARFGATTASGGGRGP